MTVYTSPYKLDGNGKGGGILVYLREDIPSKLITATLQKAEGFFLEKILEKRNRLFFVHITHIIKQSSHVWKVWAKLLTHSLHKMRTF